MNQNQLKLSSDWRCRFAFITILMHKTSSLVILTKVALFFFSSILSPSSQCVSDADLYTLLSSPSGPPPALRRVSPGLEPLAEGQTWCKSLNPRSLHFTELSFVPSKESGGTLVMGILSGGEAVTLHGWSRKSSFPAWLEWDTVPVSVDEEEEEESVHAVSVNFCGFTCWWTIFNPQALIGVYHLQFVTDSVII